MSGLALGLGAQMIACAVVGMRLLALGRRTRKLPELAFGSGFMLLGVLGHPLSIAARLPFAGEPISGPLLAAGFTAQNFGCLALCVGIWRVFRPEAAWAAGLVAAAGAAMAASFLGQAVSVGFAGGADHGFWYWIGLLARGGTYVWGAWEALGYWTKMRRRLALGLADPVVTDRFRLWGTAMAALVVAFATFLTAKLAGLNAAADPLVGSIASLAALVCATHLWLAFFPPAAYLRHVAARWARPAAASP